MNADEIVDRIIYESVESVVQGDEVPERSGTIVLIGDEGWLDSMGFVNFVVAVEDALESELGVSINLAEILDTDPATPKPQITTGNLGAFLKVIVRQQGSGRP